MRRPVAVAGDAGAAVNLATLEQLYSYGLRQPADRMMRLELVAPSVPEEARTLTQGYLGTVLQRLAELRACAVNDTREMQVNARPWHGVSVLPVSMPAQMTEPVRVQVVQAGLPKSGGAGDYRPCPSPHVQCHHTRQRARGGLSGLAWRPVASCHQVRAARCLVRFLTRQGQQAPAAPT